MEAGTFSRMPAAKAGQRQQRSGIATASLITGICSLAFFAIIPSLLFGPMAIAFGIKGRRETTATGAKGKRLADTGLVLGVIGLAAGVVFLALGLS